MSTSTQQRIDVLLIVSDDARRRRLSSVLEAEALVVAARGGEVDGLRLVRPLTPMIAVVELQPADPDALGLLDRIRGEDAQIPVVVCLAPRAVLPSAEARAHGAFACIAPGADESAELVAAVHRAWREAARRQTQRLGREMERLASVAAHDLRSPLLTISGCCYLLRETHADADHPQVREYLDQIAAEVGRLNRMIDDIVRSVRVKRDNHPAESAGPSSFPGEKRDKQ